MGSQTPPIRKQNAKLAVIPLLAAVLLWMVLGGSEEKKESSTKRSARTPASTPDQTPTASVSRKRIERPWPEFDLEKIVLYNPFLQELPDDQQAKSGQAGSEGDAEDDAPEEWPVDVFLVSHQKQTALANGYVVRPGDIVEGKWRVLALTHEKVVLEPID